MSLRYGGRPGTPPPSSARSGSLSVIVYEALDSTRAPRANNAPLTTRIQRAIAAWGAQIRSRCKSGFLRRRLNLCTLRAQQARNLIMTLAEQEQRVGAENLDHEA